MGEHAFPLTGFVCMAAHVTQVMTFVIRVSLNQTGPPLCQVSRRAPFLVPILLFSLHINDIMSDIESEIRLFADNCVCYREIKDIEDTLKLQKDIDRLGI